MFILERWGCLVYIFSKRLGVVVSLIILACQPVLPRGKSTTFWITKSNWLQQSTSPSKSPSKNKQAQPCLTYEIITQGSVAPWDITASPIIYKHQLCRDGMDLSLILHTQRSLTNDKSPPESACSTSPRWQATSRAMEIRTEHWSHQERVLCRSLTSPGWLGVKTSCPNWCLSFKVAFCETCHTNALLLLSCTLGNIFIFSSSP